MADLYGLISRMADELDYYRQLLTDDRREVHALAVEARAALAAEADGPAVPDGREPASVVGEPSDEEIMELMPQQFRDDLATVSRLASYGTPVEPGLFRVSLNTGALDYARAVLSRYGHQPAPPGEGEVGELVAWLRDAAFDLNGSDPAKSMLTRAADLLEQQATAYAICERERLHQSTRAADLEIERHPTPVPVSERLPGHVEQALIKAECALSDIAEGEPEEENEGDSAALLSWAEQRAAAVLAHIRPVMREHGIRTSEWPLLPTTALPLPQGEVQP